MQTRLTLKPGQKGTRKLLDLYGPRLVCVRYCYDEQRHKRYKTVELIVEESSWTPPLIEPETLVGVRIAFKEAELQRQVKQAGAKWNSARRVWEMRYDQALALGLEGRIEKRKASISRCPKAYTNRC